MPFNTSINHCRFGLENYLETYIFSIWRYGVNHSEWPQQKAMEIRECVLFIMDTPYIHVDFLNVIMYFVRIAYLSRICVRSIKHGFFYFDIFSLNSLKC